MASTISGSVQAENSRQGVEINGFAQVFASALPRILSNSTPTLVLDGRPITENRYFDETVTTQVASRKLGRAPNHQAEQRDLGVPKTHYDDTPFEEMLPLEPVTYVGDENWDVRYPVILDAISPIDPGTYDGVLEPLAIRDVATRTNTESPFESRRVRGTWANAHEDLLGKSVPIEQRVYYEGYQGETRAYQEFGDNLERPIDLKFTYFPDEPLLSVPFEDGDDATLMTSRVSDDSFVNVLERATGSYTKFGLTFRSTNNGYTFRDTENGTDSLAFLDRFSYLSGSSPFSSRQRILRRSSPVNIGFSDADTVSHTTPFDATRVIEGSQNYYPGAQSTNPAVSGYKNQDISTTALSSLIQRSIPETSEEISHPEFKEDVNKRDLLLPDGTLGKSFFKIDISSKANWDPAHEVYQLGPTTYDFRNSVIAHWNFETPVTGSGNGTVPDKSGNGHTGTLYGDASVDLNWAPGPITSRGNLNLERNADNSGNHDFMQISDSADLRMQLGSGKSFSFWIRVASLPQSSHYIFTKTDSIPRAEYTALVNNSGDLSFRVNDNDSTFHSSNYLGAQTSGTSITPGRWFHVVMSYAGGTSYTDISFYVNGVAVATTDSSNGSFDTPLVSSNNLCIGRLGDNTGGDFIGRISSFEIYNRVITSSEALAMYELQLQGTQYMGRTDSRMASLTKTANWAGGSLFLSSAFRNISSSFDRYNGHETGIAGTGFYYYSPFYKRWVEKRPDHATSISNSRYWTGTGGNTRDKDEKGAVNSIEINQESFYSGESLLEGKYQKVYKYIDDDLDNDVLALSTNFSVTGTNEIMSQFAASPQLGYFLNQEELLRRSGYGSIGSPTTTFGAPSYPKYHAFDEETIKMSDYIDRPFLLRKMIIKVPMQVWRRHDAVTSSFSTYHDSMWTRNVPARKDMDNYTFFLYRQRRTSKLRDSVSDISSSARFLIASSSVCVYNSSSFGQARFDGFYDLFGSNTPVSQSLPGGSFSESYVKDLVNFMTGQLEDPITQSPLTDISRPLHNPSLSINSGLNGCLTRGGSAWEFFLASGRARLVSYPAVVRGGYPVPTLFHLTSSQGNVTSSYRWSYGGMDPAGIDNYLFSRYPYTGSYNNLTGSSSPPITTVVQNFWFGGTRQPKITTESIVSGSSSTLSLGDSEFKTSFKPYVQFKPSDPYFVNQESLNINSTYTDPTFDIEIGRVGLSLFNQQSNVFEQQFEIAVDGRTSPITLRRNAVPRVAGVFQRSNLVNFGAQGSELSNAYGSQFTVGHLSGSSMAELISSLTVGYSPVSEAGETQVVSDYLLLPTDELVLGLDAGVTPPPDVTPMRGQPRPDYQSVTPVTQETSSTSSPLFSGTRKKGDSIGGVKSNNSGRSLSLAPVTRNPYTDGGIRTSGGQPPYTIPPVGRRSIDLELGNETSGGTTAEFDGENEDGSSSTWSSGNSGGLGSCWMEGPPADCMEIVGWTGRSKALRWRDWGSFIDVDPGTGYRPKNSAFVNPIMRETISRYSGSSYLRILHGEAEIILIGEYLSDGTGKQVTRSSFSSDMTQVVGDSFIVDRFDNAEGDSFSGTYLADIVTGSFFAGTRGVAADGASRNAASGSNVRRFVKMSSDSVIIHDLFFSGVNESPASAFRNAPQLPSFVPSVLDKILGGRSYASGSFFRGRAALRRKPSINISAQFRPDHWGYLSDLVEGVENTKTYDTADPSAAKIESSPVTVRFVSGNSTEIPTRTSCQNVSKTSAVDTPYVDGQAVSRGPIDDEDIITA